MNVDSHEKESKPAVNGDGPLAHTGAPPRTQTNAQTKDNGTPSDSDTNILGKLGIPTENGTTNTAADQSTEKPIAHTPPPPPPKDETPGKAVASDKANDVEYDEKHPPEDDSVVDSQPGMMAGDDGRSEIQSIMEQFGAEGSAPGEDEIMSPIRERASFFSSRASSMDPEQSPTSPSLRRPASRDSAAFPKVRPPSIAEGLPPLPPPDSEKPELSSPKSPVATSVFQPPPPSPDPEPAQPFDFHRFLEQLRHRTADPVARFLRSFLNEFAKKQWMVHEQVKIISDFLEFIAKKMSQCEVWRTVSDAEFDNAREGMEKLVMNRLYSQTFSPVIPPMEVPPQPKSRRLRAQAAAQNGPGRKGQHQEDVERDDVIAQKIRIYGWIREEHLDFPSLGDKGRKFLSLAQQELLKINSYRAPRDKVIQILNCCKVIFGFLKNNKTDQSADSFVPLLIYTVLRANPPHLASNVQYILRFRNQDKLNGEAGYYISSLSGVISFIENLDRTNLTISDEEFERNVEAAVSAIAEGHRAEEYEAKTANLTSPTDSAPSPSLLPTPTFPPLTPFGEKKSTLSRPEVTPRNSSEAERSSPRRAAARRFGSDTSVPSSPEKPSEDLASGLLRTIQRPLTNIGRIFSDDGGSSSGSASTSAPPLPPRDPSPRDEREMMRFFAGSGSRSRQASAQPSGRRAMSPTMQVTPPPPPPQQQQQQEDTRAAEEAVRMASRADAEAQRIRSEEHRVVVETLQGMFPDLDREVISDVVRMKEGRVGMAVDACLALST
ncbi:hypothetical protein K461DRAFT_284706 [Myriangium duriaei CBS 260.36]|uniref:VPS9 domain-containing protein n=1 Tax=Myriangium duriaei CBS 260.36 TaxID=1168546 RepID=A0A9P4JAD6_9PEZI|nr:hypothetical protein K461DRAFT_284706 [Myriangium duriaei CBS 260.36]